MEKPLTKNTFKVPSVYLVSWFNLLHLTWPFNLCDFLNDEYFHRQSGMIRVSNVRLIQLNLISCLHMTSAKDDVEDSRDKKLKKAWEKKWAWMECQNDSKKVCKSFLQSIKIFKNQDSIITSLKRRVHLTFLRRKNLWCFKIVWCSISIVFWVWGLATLALEMDAENPSSLVFHAPKKRWQVYYLALE